jgi:hexosaminidase
MTSRIVVGVCLVCLTSPACAQKRSAVDLVPRPQSVATTGGWFELSDPVRIVVASPDERADEIASFLARVVRERTGFEVRLARGGADRIARAADAVTIVLGLGLEAADPEAYALRVTRDEITIVGAGSEGLLWGVQTFRQLLPPEFEDADGERWASWPIPAVEIEDAPRFGWRGSLMDVARHFFPVDFVKRYIDLLSRYKMNVLHWHLTEDQGWRLEIEDYPRLTEVAAWRTEPDGSRHGGYYTREDVLEIVEYARLRGVRVVPEIEMPGHASAALVAYPELACAEPPFEVPTSWGVFRDIYCVGKPETFEFLENVLSEVAELFPFEYVHVGGDEVPKERWEECASCQALMRREGLHDEEALQAWFLRRIAGHLDGLGKTMIGWDEILEGGGVPGSVVQVWRDPVAIREAIRRGHDVVASPTSHAYFDYSPAALPLDQVYSFDPTAGLAPDERPGVLGGEGNLWSEYITTANFDLQAFPRLLALAEVLWSPAEREYRDFKARLDAHQYARLRAMGVRPGPEAGDIVRIDVGTDSLTGAPRVTVESAVEGIEVRYTTDHSRPTARSPLLTNTTTFSDGDQVALGVFAGGEPIPLRRGFSVVDHLARGTSIKFEYPPDVRYPGPSPGALIDGLRGSDNHHDGVWQGWWDHDLGATIDLGRLQSIRSVSLSFLDNEGAWIIPPDSIAIFLSPDGETWTEADGEWTTEDPRGSEPGQARAALSFRDPADSPEARFIRVDGVRAALPAGHPGAGGPGWLFVDEIVVR